jgi:DNA-binding response OmpR family regulator
MKTIKKTIRVVDDDAKIRQAMTLRLMAAGYTVLTARDGVAGLMLVESRAPDLIIADIWMPNGAGFAFGYRLKEAASTIPVIFITASKLPKLRQAAQEFGAADFLEKPYESYDLLAAVSRALAATRKTAPVPVVVPEMPKRPCKVLVVEDDERIAASLAIRLKAAGYEYDLAFDSWSGVICATTRSPDLVVLDISLPQGSGFEVAERLQKLLRPAIPVIFLTASKQPGLRERAQNLGAVGFFEKPYDATELFAAIGKATGHVPAAARVYPASN